MHLTVVSRATFEEIPCVLRARRHDEAVQIAQDRLASQLQLRAHV